MFAGAATVVLFAIGVDWLRWFAALGCMLLIVSSFALLAREGTDENTPRSDHITLPRSPLVVALYLAAIAPLPDFVFPKDAVRVLVLKQ